MRERIVVVDDDPDLRDALLKILQASGYVAVGLSDGAAVSRLVERGDVDLVILDVMMPWPNGLEVCRQIKSSPHGKRTPVVLFTALGRSKDVIAGLEAGADAFLSKPLDAAELVSRVGALLRFQKAQRLFDAGRTLPELVNERIAQLAESACLSRREREVLDLLLLGRSMEEVGTVLGITPRTAKFHQANLLAKLGAESRHDLLRLFL